jgi:hypothetical protein
MIFSLPTSSTGFFWIEGRGKVLRPNHPDVGAGKNGIGVDERAQEECSGPTFIDKRKESGIEYLSITEGSAP